MPALTTLVNINRQFWAHRPLKRSSRLEYWARAPSVTSRLTPHAPLTRVLVLMQGILPLEAVVASGTESESERRPEELTASQLASLPCWPSPPPAELASQFADFSVDFATDFAADMAAYTHYQDVPDKTDYDNFDLPPLHPDDIPDPERRRDRDRDKDKERDRDRSKRDKERDRDYDRGNYANSY